MRALSWSRFVVLAVLALAGCDPDDHEETKPPPPSMTLVDGGGYAPPETRYFDITLFVRSNTGMLIAGAQVELWYGSHHIRGFTDPDGVLIWPDRSLEGSAMASTLFYDITAEGFAPLSGDQQVGDIPPYSPNVFVYLVPVLVVDG